MSLRYSEDLLAELMAAFTSEGAELIEALNRNLVALEDAADAETRADLLRSVFREAHTLKGGAGAVDLAEVGRLSHELESLFAGVQADEIDLGRAEFNIVYRTLDAIESLIRAAGSGEEPADVDVEGLLGELQRISGKTPSSDGSPAGASQDRPDGEPAELPSDAAAAEQPEEAVDERDAGSPASPRRDEGIRVSTAKLDALLAQVGELVVTGLGGERDLQSLRHLEEQLAELEATLRKTRSFRRNLVGDGDGGAEAAISPGETVELVGLLDRADAQVSSTRLQLRSLQRSLAAASRRMSHVTDALHDDVRHARMMPIESILGPLPRMIRDLATKQGKEVSFLVEGGDTELDRAVLEQLKAPLMHLLRNCVDHGLEMPEERVSTGKPREGTVMLRASQAGDSVEIEVSDDGRGIDPAAVTESAIAKDLITSDEAGELGEEEALDLIFRPGLSTSAIITDVSGRGVGLDVVRSNVERLRGRISLRCEPEEGTRFTLTIPLTVATTHCVIARIGTRRVAVPIAGIRSTVRLDEQEIFDLEGRRTIRVGEDPLELGHLESALGFGSPAQVELGPVLVLEASGRLAALMVDEIADVVELVVKGLPSRLGRVQRIAGAALLDTGDVVLVLDVAEVVQKVSSISQVVSARGAEEDAFAEERRKPVIVLADDSLTTRTLEKNILQEAGYDVRAAADGLAAWTMLQTDAADLVVSDVQMPRMDGIELTMRIRADAELQHLPVVLVTSLDSDEDRERGIEAGADAYIVKSRFDQEQLIDVIQRLI